MTLVSNADYALGARALARSLRLSRTAADIVVLHTGGVAAEALAPVGEFGVRLRRCALLPLSEGFNAAHGRDRLHGAAPFLKGEKPAFHTPLDNFVKLRLWQLEEYARVVFLDADTLVLRNIDVLFQYPEFSAAPNVYEGLEDFARLNSGVFVARPDGATFAAMMAALDVPGAFWRADGSELPAGVSSPAGTGCRSIAICCSMCGSTCPSCGTGGRCGCCIISMKSPGRGIIPGATGWGR